MVQNRDKLNCHRAPPLPILPPLLYCTLSTQWVGRLAASLTVPAAPSWPPPPPSSRPQSSWRCSHSETRLGYSNKPRMSRLRLFLRNSLEKLPGCKPKVCTAKSKTSFLKPKVWQETGTDTIQGLEGHKD